MADEQVGNNSWMTMTPGSAVAGQLQNILTQKRVEARQAMLDELNRKNVESEMSYRDENAKSLAENRAAQAQFRTENANKTFLGELGDNPSPLDPQTAARLGKIAPNRLQTTPAGSTLPSTQAPLAGVLPGAQAPELPNQTTQSPAVDRPASYQYTGSPAYQKQHDTQKKLEDLIDDSSLSSEERMLRMSTLFPNSDPAPMYERYITSKSQQAPGHQFAVDPVSKKRIDLGPIGPNDKIEMLPRPPKDPVEPATTSYWSTGPDGKKALMIVERDGRQHVSTTPEGYTLDDKVGHNTPLVKPPHTSAVTWNRWSDAMHKVQQGNVAAEPDLNAQAAKVAQEEGFDPQVTAHVLNEFRNPANRARSPKFVPDGQGTTSADAAKATELWNLLTAGFKASAQ